MQANQSASGVEARKRSEDLVVVGRKLNDDGFFEFADSISEAPAYLGQATRSEEQETD